MKNLTPLTFNQGVHLMREEGFDYDDFAERWSTWIDRGDDVLIFSNEDLSHFACGALCTMPWGPDDAERNTHVDLAFGRWPRFAPDHHSIGMGWRYCLKYVIRRWTPGEVIALMNAYSKVTLQVILPGLTSPREVSGQVRDTKKRLSDDGTLGTWERRITTTNGTEFFVSQDTKITHLTIDHEEV